MATMRVEYTEPYRCIAEDGGTGDRIETTAGYGDIEAEKTSPGALLLASLGTCTMATVAIAARHKYEIDLSGATVDIAYEYGKKPYRLESVQMTIHLPVEPPEEKQRQSIERAAEACPVKRSLGDFVDVQVEFDWAEESS